MEYINSLDKTVILEIYVKYVNSFIIFALLIKCCQKEPPELFYVKGFPEAATRGAQWKVFLEISQNSQENTCARSCF